LDARACGSQADITSLIDLLAVAVNERAGAAGTLGRVLEQVQLAAVKPARAATPITIFAICMMAISGGRLLDAHRLVADGPVPVRECNYSFDVDNIRSTYRAIMLSLAVNAGPIWSRRTVMVSIPSPVVSC
jgi:hypothetical protein